MNPDKFSDRQRYERENGMAFFTRVNAAMLPDVANGSLEPAAMEPYLLHNIGSPENFRPGGVVEANPAGTSLFMAMHRIKKTVPHFDGHFRRRYGISKADAELAGEHSTDLSGFSDVEFTWVFAPAALNAVTEFEIEQGRLTREQRDAFRLSDWADRLDSDWFRALMNDMARTGQTAYQVFGLHLESYAPGALEAQLQKNDVLPSGVQLFATKDNVTVLTHEARLALREFIGPESVGCPVAHHQTTLSPEQAVKDQNVQMLVAAGLWHAVEGPEGAKRVRYTQVETAIDRTLKVVADQLRAYDQQYGTPHLVRVGESYARASDNYAPASSRLSRRSRCSLCFLLANCCQIA